MGFRGLEQDVSNGGILRKWMVGLLLLKKQQNGKFLLKKIIVSFSPKNVAL